MPSAGSDGCDVLIYATSPVSSIVAKCEANGFVRGSAETLWRQIGKVSGCTKNEFFDYFADAKHPSAIWLRNVFPIQPLTLEALRKDLGWHPPVAWCYLDSGSPILSWIRER